MHRAQIDLRTLECEKTHFIRLPLEDGAGSLSLLITITGMFSSSFNDLETTGDNNELFTDNPYKKAIIKKYVS